MTRMRWFPWTSSAAAAEPAMVEADPADLGTDLGLEARLGLSVSRPAGRRAAPAAATMGRGRRAPETGERFSA